MLITKINIENLFDNLWPAMLYAQHHKLNCIEQLKPIQNYFNKISDHNVLLKNLCSLDGIGVTIGTGLIWSVFSETRVPFDKYTLTYALNQNIIRTEKVSDNYVSYSQKVKEFCDDYTIEDRPYTIEDFVRDAMVELEDSEYLAEPK